ncbi:hypothetical protein W97_05474 [Coniosporium apollinis CBS 100218]|uniref:MARVEL domain-containing protein n=1 Tax=Coniosporium apollinis (strain CBS 100218) TaxID=1168221 RepID=R7YWU2_CONA1|nr:uncharacterized protein W97_05474 [Coniosporium apollinis CBS 100218]EON66377.1 hypothetical protein W97_05474 [Coniosporium apollinis CBS 100218]
MARTITLLTVFGPVIVCAIPQRGNFIGMAQCSSLPSIIRMTVEQCEQICGIGWHAYEKWEVVSALATWVIPLFVLRLAGVGWTLPAQHGACLSTTASWPHTLLGNPIDVIWSHLEKLEHMHRTQQDDAALAIIRITLDDFDFDHGAQSTAKIEARETLSAILIRYKNSLGHTERIGFLEKCHDAAFLLAHNRTSSTRRAALAVIAYAVALFTSLASAMAQNSAAVHTPHTLALRELYYWLISAIALSSATGAFPTEHTAWADLKPVISAISDSQFNLAPLKPWTGGSYCYRPHKRIKGRSIPLLGLSILAVGGAWAISFTMSWITPTRGLGCRSFMELGFFAAWVINFLVSYCIARTAHEKWPKGAFVATFICDIIIAVPSVLPIRRCNGHKVIIIDTHHHFSGWFNSCKCWAAFWTVRRAAAHYVPVGLAAQEHALAPTYFTLLACALGVQVLLSGGILVHYRRELRLIYGGQLEGPATSEVPPHHGREDASRQDSDGSGSSV